MFIGVVVRFLCLAEVFWSTSLYLVIYGAVREMSFRI
jgi:hypothetical protein